MLKTLCFIYPLKVLLMISIYEKEKQVERIEAEITDLE